MKKLSLTVIGFYLGILASFSQSQDSSYKNKKLSLEEVNFVSGYYNQDGNHSAVTGGIGTEELTDFANTIELKLTGYDGKSRKHGLNLELGIDHYSSASSDKIDPSTISSASYSDTRIYPTVGWTIQDLKKGTTVGLTGSFSHEYDYNSIGIAGSYTKATPDNNNEFTVKAQAYFDRWKVIYPIELRGPGNEKSAGSSPRNSFTASLSFSRVINEKLQFSVIADPTYQEGLLATKYQRVYFTDGSVKTETLPESRFKIPVGIRANYFAGDRFILRSFYRYYMDNWGVKAHSIELELPVKITAFLSLSPFYRFYSQSASDYFAPFEMHHVNAVNYTSDYDLSKFNSHFFGAGVRIIPPNGVFGIQRFSSAELRGGHYTRSEGLNANSLSLHLTFK